MSVHLQVGEDDVEVFLLDLLGPGRAAGGDDALVADAFQALGHRLGVERLVVDDEHLEALAHFFGILLARFIHIPILERLTKRGQDL